MLKQTTSVALYEDISLGFSKLPLPKFIVTEQKRGSSNTSES